MNSLATDVSEAIPASGDLSLIGRAKHVRRLVGVLVGMEIKLRYGDSVLGYVWTIGKPMALFSILYVVFGQLVGINAEQPHFALYLVTGVMLWTFFAEGVSRTMSSIVANGTLLRKLPFPRLVIPLAASLTSFVTFGLSLFAIAVFVLANRIVPQPDWLLLIPLVFELYLWVFGLGLILAVLYVRLRDIAQVWDLTVQLLFFASPIIYSFTLVDSKQIQKIMLLNPFTQIMQDVRALVIYADPNVIVAPTDFSPTRVVPLAIVAFFLGLGLWMFKRADPWLPEQV